MLRNIVFICLLFFTISSSITAQENSGSWTDRIFTGGNLGLQFGTTTVIDVSPLIGYRITDKLGAGITATYKYYRFRTNIGDYTTSIYGGGLFGRYLITENLFAHAEYEILNGPWRFDDERYNITSILIGGGYRQPLSDRIFLNLLVLWNINDSADSPYNNPIIRAGVGVGF